MNWTDVEKFLLAVRRRLWLQAGLERLQLGVWAGSTILLAAAAVNLLWAQVTLATAVFTALSSVLVVTLTALTRRPRLEACALCADRIFHTQELMVTALELSVRTTRPAPPAAVVVRNRACAAAQQLKHQLGDVWRAPRPGSLVPAVIPIFVATMLFAGANGNPATSDDPVSPSASPDLVGQSRRDSNAGLQELRQSIASGAPRGNERRDAKGSPMQGASLTPRDQAAAELPAPAQATKARGGIQDLPTENAEGGREAGNARRADAFAGNRELTGSTPSLRETVWLSRRGEAAADAGDGGWYIETSETPLAFGEGVAQASAAPPRLSTWTALTPAEAAYARRYLGSRETDSD